MRLRTIPMVKMGGYSKAEACLSSVDVWLKPSSDVSKLSFMGASSGDVIVEQDMAFSSV